MTQTYRIDPSHLSLVTSQYKPSLWFRVRLMDSFSALERNFSQTLFREKLTILHCQDPRESHWVEDCKSLKVYSKFDTFYYNWKKDLGTSKSEGMSI